MGSKSDVVLVSSSVVFNDDQTPLDVSLAEGSIINFALCLPCPECDQKVGELARQCPHCMCSLSESRNKQVVGKNVRGWESNEVIEFIKSIGAGGHWEAYAKVLRAEGIDGGTLLHMSSNDLINIGLKPLHAKAVVAELSERSGEAMPADAKVVPVFVPGGVPGGPPPLSAQVPKEAKALFDPEKRVLEESLVCLERAKSDLFTEKKAATDFAQEFFNDLCSKIETARAACGAKIERDFERDVQRVERELKWLKDRAKALKEKEHEVLEDARRGAWQKIPASARVALLNDGTLNRKYARVAELKSVDRRLRGFQAVFDEALREMQNKCSWTIRFTTAVRADLDAKRVQGAAADAAPGAQPAAPAPSEPARDDAVGSSIEDIRLYFERDMSLRQIEVGIHADVRDKFGKWLKAEVVETKSSGRLVKIHYHGWDRKWDEWIDVKRATPYCFMPFGSISSAPDPGLFKVGDAVRVPTFYPKRQKNYRIYLLDHLPMQLATVTMVDKAQVQVRVVHPGGSRHEFWFDQRSPEINKAVES